MSGVARLRAVAARRDDTANEPLRAAVYPRVKRTAGGYTARCHLCR